MGRFRIPSIDNLDYGGKTVLLRVDINSPIHPETKRITNHNRLDQSLPTIRDLSERGAKLVMIAHQGDTLDYQNLISLEEHASLLSQKLGKQVQFVDDVAGPAAREAIRRLQAGEILLLDNLRYLTEEVSTFENDVKLTPEEMTRTYLVRNLAPLMDFYVNDAFAAAHRNSPSMVAFQELLPSAGGRLLMKELEALGSVLDNPARPCVFVLGGAKISDAFSIMKQVLSTGAADLVLTSGVTGQVMLMAQGKSLGEPSEDFIKKRSLDKFVAPARDYLSRFPGKLLVPSDVAMEEGGQRKEVSVAALPVKGLIIDVGPETMKSYCQIVQQAGTIFVNGPPGVYEKPLGEEGTRKLWLAIAGAPGYSVIGGGDTVSSATRFVDIGRINYVSTAGGALIRFLSGVRLPLLEAMEKAGQRQAGMTTARGR
jgi:phosphoglycerate kinase